MVVADTTPITLALYRCCEATEEIPATCTYPLTQNNDVDRESICPAPPRVSYDDVTNNEKGKLDSDLTFVDEYLLHRAEDLEPDVYKRRLQGGFVISYMEPEFGICGSDESIADDSFLLCTNIQDSDYYTLNTDKYNMSVEQYGLIWLNSMDNCPLLYTNSSVNSTGLVDSDSLVDGISARIVQGSVCSDDKLNKTRPPAMYTANFIQQKMAATVYYNSEVS